MNYCILLFLPTKPVFKNTPHPDCHVGGRGGDSEWQGEWDKGLPCVILSSLCGCTASIKEVQPSESSCLIVTTAFNNIFQDSDLENVGRINVIKMWFLLSSSCPFFHFAFLSSPFMKGLCSKHLHFLTLTCSVSLSGKADTAIRHLECKFSFCHFPNELKAAIQA